MVNYLLCADPNISTPSIYQQQKLQINKYSGLISAYKELGGLYSGYVHKSDEYINMTMYTVNVTEIKKVLEDMNNIRDKTNILTERIYELEKDT